ncbi:PepSY domain-containing protein [Shewanella sedimentimangrovi]|uniref:PepSY domain-containing protein n=1 Tax=Shewanella sedimentimangrovi TaxID=2814293 RepID=A0ABX7R0B4_9GAMM|nr:hypothetical protein [Shewanella sedimentimangrovi]QSX36626.1 hypothetical protein JYB85_15265 [Shewanella sedimentimangrovi]
MFRPLLLCCGLLVSLTAAANPIELHHYQAKQLVAAGQILSLETTLAGLRELCPGELLDARLYSEDDHWRYDLQFALQHGQIIRLSLDASTGHPQTDIPQECHPDETATR